MKISHTKQEIDGVKSEYIELTLTDLRYPSITTSVHLSLEESNLLLAELSKKLAPLPY